MFAIPTFLSFTDIGLLAAVVGLYAVLGGLWLVYWVIQKRSQSVAARQVERRGVGTVHDSRARRAHRTLAMQPAQVSDDECELDELSELRAELIMIREASNKARTRAAKLEVEVEALRLRVADLERDELTEAETDEAAKILSLYEPHLEKYDSEWATTDPNLGVILAKRPETPDDLTRISGIGKVNQERLNEYGIFYIQQIADWSDLNISQFNALLAFKGRIEREDWVGQAERLLRPDGQSEAA